MFHKVPIELYEEILSSLWDDKDSLSACSLSSRLLTVPSQKLLFSRIILRGSPKIRKHQPSKVYSVGGTSSNFKELLNRSPHIADYVECLQIIDIRPYIWTSLSDDDSTSESEGEDSENMVSSHEGDDRSVEGSSEGSEDLDSSESYEYRPFNAWISNDESLPTVLPLLQKVKALVIDYVEKWGHVSRDVRISILHLLQLPSLVYIDLTPFPFAILTRAVSDNIQHLCIRTISFTKHVQSFIPDCTSPTPIYLESLLIGELKTTFLWISDCRVNFNRLRKLEIDASTGTEEDHASTWAFLQKCKNTLEHFKITPQVGIRRDLADPYVNQYQEPIDVSQLPLLKTFTVDLQCYDNEEQGTYIDSIWWLVKVLRAGSSFQELQELTIQVDSFDMKNTNIKPWQDVSNLLLVADRFPSLKTLNIWITYFKDGKEVPTRIAEVLDESEFMEHLRTRRGLKVNVSHCPSHHPMVSVPYQFAPDPRWENALSVVL